MTKFITFRGMKINVENTAGSVRSGVDRITGKPWKTKLTHDYGEIVGTKGADGDSVDCFLGPDSSAPFVYVVHQLQKHTGEWDEDKCFLGFDDAMDAKAAYYKNYDNPDVFYGSIEAIPLKVFKQQLLKNNGDTMIHAQGEIHKGDPVTVDGMRGRGVVTEEDGSDVVIRYRNGIHIKRNKMFVHPMSDNYYHSRYSSIRAGGPGSGRKPGFVRGLNKWKSLEQERKMAQRDPRQASLFDTRPKPSQPARKYDPNDPVYKSWGGIFEKKVAAGEEMVERENGPITVPHGANKRIEEVGSLFCVVSDGTDKNFGCYGSREQAQAVLEGRSFIEPDLPANLQAFGDLGEPMAGSLAHGHMEPNAWFHAPSLMKRGKADYVPTDDPMEKDDRFLDVTKRKQSHTDRMKRLKRSAPGGLPPMIPVHTTLLEPHQSGFAPTIAGAKVRLKKSTGLIDVIPRNTTLLVPHQIAYTRPARDPDDKRMRKAYHATAHI